MPQTRKTPLNRHEELRYDYLSKRLNDLNDKERAELNFLQAKRAGRLNPVKQASQREAQPSPVSQPKKTWKKGLTYFVFFLLFLLLGLSFFFIRGLKTARANYQPASSQVFNGQTTDDGVNILILGSDKRPIDGDEDARTDSIMVLNIGNSSGQPKLVSFMRDTLVNIGGYSSWGLADHKINASFSLGQQEGNLGAELVRQTLKDNFDLDIQYYMMVDFETFAVAIDTLFPEGVEIYAQFSTVDGEVVDRVEVPDDLGFASGGSLYQTIMAGQQLMDGKTLLNYARFRTDDSGDFGRTQRQQQVLSAIVSQIKDPTKLFTGSEALGKVYALTSTNIDFTFILTKGLAALIAGQGGIEQLTIPELGDWIDAYDAYGGQGLLIDFDAYQAELADLGLR